MRARLDTLPAARPAVAPPAARPRRRRSRYAWVALAAVVVFAAAFGIRAFTKNPPPGEPNPGAAAPPVVAEPIKVGVLFSTTGQMAVSEGPLLDSTLLAIEELNRAGGVLGRPVRAVVVDGKSDPAEFGRQAKRLLTEEKVAVIFGCWMSSALKNVRAEVERHDGLLFFPVHYEGLEESPRVVYLGLTPNQQLLPGLNYLTDTLKKRRLYLLGGSDVYSHATHAMLRDWILPRPGVEVVGEAFLPFGSQDVAATVANVVAAKPDAIVNTIDGGTNFVLFPRLRAAGVAPDRVPAVSVSITETELRGIGPEVMAGNYLAASYFQSVMRPEGIAFREKIQGKYSKDRSVSDLMGVAFTAVKLWAQAATAAGSAEAPRVAAAVKGMEIDGVAGRVRIDPETMHTWRPWRIGEVRPDGSVKVVAESAGNVRPIPFPDTRPRDEWNRFLTGLFTRWKGSWEEPPKP